MDTGGILIIFRKISDLEDTLTMTNPSKRQREESSALDEVDKKALLEMIELNKKMDEKSADQITQADTNAMQQKTFAFLCSIVPKILETLATSNELKKQVGSLQKEVNNLKNEVLNQQIRLSAKSVVIRDLPQIKAGRESQLELKNQFENVLCFYTIVCSILEGFAVARSWSSSQMYPKGEFLHDV